MPFKKTVALLLCIAASVSALPSVEKRTLPSGTQTGTATFFTPGQGVCGTSSESDLITAVSSSIFGAKNPDNPICDKKIKVSSGGKSVTVTVQDACTACGAGDLDLSSAAFKKLADPSTGRIPITWSVV